MRLERRCARGRIERGRGPLSQARAQSASDSAPPGRLWQALLLAVLVAGCALPLLERDASYPAGWPPIVGAVGDCGVLGGTFANKGTLIDKGSDKQDIWLTGLLPMSERMPAGDPKHQERAALRSCERVTLRFEKYPWPDRPNVGTWRVVVDPERKVGREASERWESCKGFHLPVGRGWPLDGSLSAVCAQNAYMLYADPGEIVADSFALSLARGSDGSLIARWDYGPTWAMDHVWARFEKLP